MIQNVPGGAIFETPAGSAGSRTSDAQQQRQTSQEAGASDKTSAAHDAKTEATNDRPVAQTGGAERSTDDAPRGRGVDIRV